VQQGNLKLPDPIT